MTIQSSTASPTIGRRASPFSKSLLCISQHALAGLYALCNDIAHTVLDFAPFEGGSISGTPTLSPLACKTMLTRELLARSWGWREEGHQKVRDEALSAGTHIDALYLHSGSSPGIRMVTRSRTPGFLIASSLPSVISQGMGQPSSAMSNLHASPSVPTLQVRSLSIICAMSADSYDARIFLDSWAVNLANGAPDAGATIRLEAAVALTIHTKPWELLTHGIANRINYKVQWPIVSKTM